MDPLWIVAAFAFGAVSTRIGLPPLVGYLVAGFVLNSFGVAGGDILARISDAGVTLLLFTIGLKLKLKTLARPEVWAGATGHMLITAALLFGGLTIAGALGAAHFQFSRWQTATLIAFTLSFSSTVFAVKVFEQKKELSSRINLVMLTLPDPKSSVFAIRQMHQSAYQGQIAASVRYVDEIDLLKAEGIDAVYSLYEEAGVGFTDHVCSDMDYCQLIEAPKKKGSNLDY